MKLKVDAELCSGHGRCYVLAPTVYKADVEGYNAARGEVIEVPPDQEEAARAGQRGCPEHAIRIVRDGAKPPEDESR